MTSNAIWHRHHYHKKMRFRSILFYKTISIKKESNDTIHASLTPDFLFESFYQRTELKSFTNMSSLSIILYSLQRYLVFVVSWLYLTFGFIGCCLNICLFCRKQFRSISCCTCKLISYLTCTLYVCFFSLFSRINSYGYSTTS